MPELELWQWLAGISCAFMIGIAKTGFPGIAVFVIPLMVLTVGDARYAAAWTLPMLSTGDFFAVAYWHRQADIRKLFSLIPWVAVGMVIGGVALAFPEALLRRVIGGIVMLMVVLTVLRQNFRVQAVGHTSLYGIPAGFATTVANAASPVMHMYLLAGRLPKEQFVATGAWFFLVVNLAKVPIYTWHELYSRASLTFDLLMVPAVICGSVAGIWLIHRIPQRIFNALIIILTTLAAIVLFA